jgi:hypothetical protein
MASASVTFADKREPDEPMTRVELREARKW